MLNCIHFVFFDCIHKNEAANYCREIDKQLKKSFEETAGVEDLKLQDVEAEYTYSKCEAHGIWMDSCLCTDMDDEKSEERTGNSWGSKPCNI